jgi:AsmA protein
MIPDTVLPFHLLLAADANVTLAFDRVDLDGSAVTAIHSSLILKDGVLRIDPLTAGEPALTASLGVDASKPGAVVHLTVRAPRLALGPLLDLAGLPRAATGTAELQADLTGTGDTPHALAATLNGWAGLAIQDGHLDERLVDQWLAQLRPLRIDGGETADLRCFAARVDLKDGIATVRPLALNTAALILDGSGEADLGHETLALRLRPRMKIAGTGAAVPLRVSGTFAAPAVKVDLSPAGLGEGMLAGLILGGKDVMGAAGGGDPCPAALARARDAPAPPASGVGKPPAPLDLLHQLLPGSGGKK